MIGRSIRGRMAVVAAATLWTVAMTPGGAAADGPAGMTGQAAQRAAMTAHHQAEERLLKELRGHVPAGHRNRAARVALLPATGDVLCVGGGAGCYRTIQAALDAARDGDTIRVSAGTFAGGITITKSVRLLGSGATSTIIKGGGSVITIGDFGAPVEPTVAIRASASPVATRRPARNPCPSWARTASSRSVAGWRSRPTPTSAAARTSRSRTA